MIDDSWSVQKHKGKLLDEIGGLGHTHFLQPGLGFAHDELPLVHVILKGFREDITCEKGGIDGVSVGAIGKSQLAKCLAHSSVFISVFEAGSEDSTALCSPGTDRGSSTDYRGQVRLWLGSCCGY